MERLIVVGASVGGVSAIAELTAALPSDLPAPVLVVLHIGEHRSTLPAIIGRRCALEVAHAAHGEILRPGRIYVAPPDHHMLVDGDRIVLSRGAKEHHTRPAIDPLFRSAALTRGADVIGAVLTGLLDDGTPGLQEIKRRGGVAVVQDPLEALAPSMPQSALKYVQVDHCAGIAAMGPLLASLAASPPSAGHALDDVLAEHEQQLSLEQGNPMEHLSAIGTPSTYACPDCHGALWQLDGTRPRRFRCHTGHAFTERSLQDTLTEIGDQAAWNALRSLQERELLLCDMAQRQRDEGEAPAAQRLEAAARRLGMQASLLRRILAESPEPVE